MRRIAFCRCRYRWIFRIIEHDVPADVEIIHVAGWCHIAAAIHRVFHRIEPQFPHRIVVIFFQPVILAVRIGLQCLGAPDADQRLGIDHHHVAGIVIVGAAVARVIGKVFSLGDPCAIQ